MALKHYNPTSPGRRALVLIDRSELHKGRPEKSLTEGLTKSGGRGAGVERLEYDPNRTAFIALIVYEDGEKAYIIAPQRLKAGDQVVAGDRVDVKPGNAMPLRSVPVGTIIHNIEMKPGKGAQLARSAGAYAQLVGRDQGYAQIRLGSGELRMVLDGCMATVGAVSNPDHMNQNLGKAGRKRHMGWRPHVRGVSMNPIDHPHGGGEGRTSGGRTPVTPWGKATDKYIIRTRHVKKAR
jgi:large subunit ribosomal protein L2